MRLEQLYKSYHEMTSVERTNFIRQYRERRFLDVQSYNFSSPKKGTGKPRVSKKKKEKVKLTPEEKALMQKLGLSHLA